MTTSEYYLSRDYICVEHASRRVSNRELNRLFVYSNRNQIVILRGFVLISRLTRAGIGVKLSRVPRTFGHSWNATDTSLPSRAAVN